MPIRVAKFRHVLPRLQFASFQHQRRVHFASHLTRLLLLEQCLDRIEPQSATPKGNVLRCGCESRPE
jgi:hypothetical protein